MASSLPFEYTPRVTDIVAQVQSGSLVGPALQQLLEQRDRDLEDYLAANRGGGGTPSILASYADGEQTSGSSGPFGYTTSFSITVPIPSDSTFTYYIDARINNRLTTTPLSDCVVNFTGSQQFVEFPNGAGYEIWGFADTYDLQADTPYHKTGFGNRIIKIPEANIGGNITFENDAGAHSSNGADTFAINMQSTCLVLALPK